MEKSLKSGGDFLKASEHPPVVFEKTKQTLNFVPFFIKFRVIKTLYGTVLFRWNDADRALLTYMRNDGICIISFVC